MSTEFFLEWSLHFPETPVFAAIEQAEIPALVCGGRSLFRHEEPSYRVSTLHEVRGLNVSGDNLCCFTQKVSLKKRLR